MTLRCPPTFLLALSLKNRQTTHALWALLLFTFLKDYDVKVDVTIGYNETLIFFYLRLLTFDLLAHNQQKPGFLATIHHYVS